MSHHFVINHYMYIFFKTLIILMELTTNKKDTRATQLPRD